MKVLCNVDTCPEITNKIYDSEIDENICCAWCPHINQCNEEKIICSCRELKDNKYDMNTCIQCIYAILVE